MNRLGRAVLNSPPRAAAQRRFVIPTFTRIGGNLEGAHALEIGCGRGFGTQLVLTQMGARTVDAIDLDPNMVDLARRRLRDEIGDGRVRVDVVDMISTGAPPGSYDAVVDLGAIHLEPAWRSALAEVRRVLRPGGRFSFEEIVRPGHQALVPVATGRRIPGGITLQSFLAELDRLDLEVIDIVRPRAMVLTGVVGDIIGVARLR